MTVSCISMHWVHHVLRACLTHGHEDIVDTESGRLHSPWMVTELSCKCWQGMRRWYNSKLSAAIVCNSVSV